MAYNKVSRLLNEANVKYVVVVGGIAALTQADFRPKIPVQALEFADENKRNQWITDKGMQVFSMYNPDQPILTIDLFVHNPIPYEELLSRSVLMDLGDMSEECVQSRT